MVAKLLASLPSLDSNYVSMTKDELNQVAKVCVGNSVYIQKLKQMSSSKDTNLEYVSFDFDVNKEFCTVKLA